MKRLRVSDIEALLGPDAARRLVEGVKDNRGRREYEVQVELVFTRNEKITAKSEKEARQILEKRLLDQYRISDQYLDRDADWFLWSDVRSRVGPHVGSKLVPTPEIELVPTPEIEKTKAPAVTPGPRKRRVPRPSRD